MCLVLRPPRRRHTTDWLAGWLAGYCERWRARLSPHPPTQLARWLADGDGDGDESSGIISAVPFQGRDNTMGFLVVIIRSLGTPVGDSPDGFSIDTFWKPWPGWPATLPNPD